MIKKILISLLLLLVISGSGVLYFLNNNNMNKDIKPINNTSEIVKLKEEKKKLGERIGKKEPLNILLIGLDGYKDGKEVKRTDSARADTIILLSINPNTNKSKLINIPRDTRVYMGKVSKYDKINHSYVYGGVGYTVELVQNLFQLPIDYYAVVNMYGLVSLVDSIGGVEVTSPLTFEYEDQLFEEGKTVSVNGEQALKFVRMRYDDPEGDFGRQKRQKLLLRSLSEKLKRMSSLDYAKLVPFLNDYVKTNVPLAQSFELYKDYKEALSNIELINIEDAYEGVIIDEIYYGMIDNDKRFDIINMLRKHSDLSVMKRENLNRIYLDDNIPRRTIDYSDLTEEYLNNEEEIINRELNTYEENNYPVYVPTETVEESYTPPAVEQPINSVGSAHESVEETTEVIHESSSVVSELSETPEENNSLDEEVIFTPIEEENESNINSQ